MHSSPGCSKHTCQCIQGDAITMYASSMQHGHKGGHSRNSWRSTKGRGRTPSLLRAAAEAVSSMWLRDARPAKTDGLAPPAAAASGPSSGRGCAPLLSSTRSCAAKAASSSTPSRPAARARGADDPARGPTAAGGVPVGAPGWVRKGWDGVGWEANGVLVDT